MKWKRGGKRETMREKKREEGQVLGKGSKVEMIVKRDGVKSKRSEEGRENMRDGREMTRKDGTWRR